MVRSPKTNVLARLRSFWRLQGQTPFLRQPESLGSWPFPPFQSQQSGILKYRLYPFLHHPSPSSNLLLWLWPFGFLSLRTLGITSSPAGYFQILLPSPDPELNHTCQVPLAREGNVVTGFKIRMWMTGGGILFLPIPIYILIFPRIVPWWHLLQFLRLYLYNYW